MYPTRWFTFRYDYVLLGAVFWYIWKIAYQSVAVVGTNPYLLREVRFFEVQYRWYWINVIILLYDAKHRWVVNTVGLKLNIGFNGKRWVRGQFYDRGQLCWWKDYYCIDISPGTFHAICQVRGFKSKLDENAIRAIRLMFPGQALPIKHCYLLKLFIWYWQPRVCVSGAQCDTRIYMYLYIYIHIFM